MSLRIANPGTPRSLKRSFRDLSDVEVADIERASVLARIGWSGSFGWDELLRSPAHHIDFGGWCEKDVRVPNTADQTLDGWRTCVLSGTRDLGRKFRPRHAEP
jgi:hypothetical protein